jgi:hypothetical protein
MAGESSDLEDIDEALLPVAVAALDALLERASLAAPGRDGDGHAAGMRHLAAQMEALLRQVDRLSSAPAQAPASPARIAA